MDQGIIFHVAESQGLVVGVMGFHHRIPAKESPAANSAEEGGDPEVILIRHAYVASAHQGRGIGGLLLQTLLTDNQSGAPGAISSKPLLLGTWAASGRAISFYQRHAFALVDGPDRRRRGSASISPPRDGAEACSGPELPSEKDRLLQLYWFGDVAGINSRDDPYRRKQMDASVVMEWCPAAREETQPKRGDSGSSGAVAPPQSLPPPPPSQEVATIREIILDPAAFMRGGAKHSDAVAVEGSIVLFDKALSRIDVSREGAKIIVEVRSRK